MENLVSFSDVHRLFTSGLQVLLNTANNIYSQGKNFPCKRVCIFCAITLKI